MASTTKVSRPCCRGSVAARGRNNQLSEISQRSLEFRRKFRSYLNLALSRKSERERSQISKRTHITMPNRETKVGKEDRRSLLYQTRFISSKRRAFDNLVRNRGDQLEGSCKISRVNGRYSDNNNVTDQRFQRNLNTKHNRFPPNVTSHDTTKSRPLISRYKLTGSTVIKFSNKRTKLDIFVPH